MVIADNRTAHAVVTWKEPGVSDNAGSVTLTSTHTSGQVFFIGNTTVTYEAVDSSGNTYSKAFVVQVKGILKARCVCIMWTMSVVER